MLQSWIKRFFEMAGIHDRYSNMRLNVDNMSYEDLLALGERIGNVGTGLSNHTITRRLRKSKYKCIIKTKGIEEAAVKCCICQEEYKKSEDLGILDCGHYYHIKCIKQWLMHKNLCPVCKTTGLKK